jgi:hypothetical protein
MRFSMKDRYGHPTGEVHIDGQNKFAAAAHQHEKVVACSDFSAQSVRPNLLACGSHEPFIPNCKQTGLVLSVIS